MDGPCPPARSRRPWTCHHGPFGGKVLTVFSVVIQPGEPAGQAVDGRLEFGAEVHEVAQPLGEPGQADLLLAAPVGQFLDAAVGEVHA